MLILQVETMSYTWLTAIFRLAFPAAAFTATLAVRGFGAVITLAFPFFPLLFLAFFFLRPPYYK
jgi:hypothetical protein